MGDPRAPTTQSGVASHLLSALEQRADTAVIPIDSSLRPGTRLVAAAISVRADRDRWRWSLHASALATYARTRRLTASLRRIGGPVDAVLHLRTIYRPTTTPYVAYIDNTADVARGHWPPSAPWGAASLPGVIKREREYFAEAAHVFTTGRLVADSVATFYGVPRSRISIVGAGSHYGVVRRPSDAPREPWIIFVGHDFYRKGGDRLLEVFSDVRRRHPSARLKLVGRGVPRGAAGPGIDVVGPVADRHKLSSLYLRSSVFVLPARYEPYGVSFLEAMGHGLPCVGSDAGAIPEIITDGVTGRVVRSDDGAQLVDAVCGLLSDGERAAAMGRAGQQRVAEELNWDAVAARIVLTTRAALDGR